MLQFPSINGHRLQIIFSVFRSHCFHLANRDVGRFHRHARGKKHDRLNRETKKRSFERPSSHVRKHSWAEKKSWNKCQIYANVQQRSRYIAKHILEKFATSNRVQQQRIFNESFRIENRSYIYSNLFLQLQIFYGQCRIFSRIDLKIVFTFIYSPI